MSEATPTVSKRSFDPRWLPLGVTTIGTFMSILDNNIINVALPTILQEFDASLAMGQLIVTSFMMALAVVIPLSGFLGERIGMKRLYMAVLVLFVVGSALCGLAWNTESLIVFRVLQGLGGGMLQPLGMALVFSIITPLERPRFVALLGVPTLLAPMIGPSVGGYIVEYLSWRAVFLINVPFGILAILLGLRLLKETTIKAETRLDAQGFAFAALAFPCLLFAFSRATDLGWTSPVVLALFGVGFLSLAIFIRTELRHHDPMLRLSLFKHPMFRLSLMVQWVGIFSLFGLNVVIPLYLQRVHGMSPAEAGLILLPMGIVAFATMNVSGRLYNRVGPRPLVMFGLAIMALTTLGWSVLDESASDLVLVLLVAARGLGMGFFGQIVQIVAYNTVPLGELPRATSLVTTFQRLTTAFSTATLTSVLVIGLGFTNAPAGTSIAAGTAPLPDMLEAFRYAFWVMTALSVIGVVMAFRLRDQVLEEHMGRVFPAKQPSDA